MSVFLAKWADSQGQPDAGFLPRDKEEKRKLTSSGCGMMDPRNPAFSELNMENVRQSGMGWDELKDAEQAPQERTSSVTKA